MADEKIKILAVDSDEFLVQVYKAKLERAGFAAEFALDDKAAMQWLAEFKPDVVLLELMMVGGSDGFDFLVQLREQPDAPAVIALTNLAEHEDISRAMDLGAVAYMIKTQVAFEQVVEKIREITK
jgi:DNA-binding response OmpR family regulator